MILIFILVINGPEMFLILQPKGPLNYLMIIISTTKTYAPSPQSGFKVSTKQHN